MSILSLNCRGLGHSSRVLLLRDMNQNHKPDIVFLYETIASVKTMESCHRLIGYDKWRLIGYCGYANRAHRRESWALIRQLAGMSPLPWCTVGDFNDLLSR